MSIDSLAADGGTISSGTAALANAGGFVFGCDGISVATAGYRGVSIWNNGLPKNAIGIISNTINISLQRATFAQPLLATRVDMAMSVSVSNSQAGSMTLSLAAYSFLNETQISLASSASQVISWTTGTATSAITQYAGQSGLRWQSIDLASWSLQPGDYMLAAAIALSEPSTKSKVSASYLGSRSCDFGIVVSGTNGGNITDCFFHGGYSVSSNAFPATIGANQIINTQTQGNFQGSFGQPYLQLAGSF